MFRNDEALWYPSLFDIWKRDRLGHGLDRRRYLLDEHPRASSLKRTPGPVHWGFPWLVHVHEIIDQALRFANGFQLDDVNSAIDEIYKVGPGRSFLSQPSTLKNYKTGYYNSRVYPRYSMEKWQEAGSPPARQVLREKTQDLLASLPIPDDHAELIGRGEEFIQKL
jgi:hypothetical protein